MANDNTVGAPTEGLGQTVTFAIGGTVGVPQMQPVGRQSVRASASGGEARRTPQALHIPEARQDPTFQVLARLGGEVLKPYVEAERSAKFMQGMQQAAQGEAIQEIVDEQPWYSKLFGSTSLVDGARVGTASAKASGMAVDFETNMKEYRKLSPGEFAKAAAGKLAEANTGDSVTDMLIAQQASQVLPQVMKNQVKEHLRFQQEQFVAAQGAALDGALSLLGTADAQARDQERVAEPVDTIGVAISLTRLLEKPAELDQKLHDNLVGDAVTKAVSSGNFAALTWLKSSGKLEQLDPDVAYRVQRAADQASARARMNVSQSFMEAEANWLANSEDKTEKDILAGAAALNARYTAETGDPSPYIPRAATVRELVQLKDMRYREAQQARDAAERAAREGDKAAQKAELHVLSLYKDGVLVTSPDGLYIGDRSAKDRQALFDHVKALAPDKYTKVLVSQHGFGTVDEKEKDAIQGGFSAAIQGSDPQLFQQAYMRYAAIVQASGGLGAAVADAYAGRFKEQAAIYHRFAQGQILPPQEHHVAMLAALNPPPKETSGKFAKAVKAHLKDNDAMQALYAAGRAISASDYIPPKDPDGLADLLVPTANQQLPVDEAVEAARAQNPHLTELGGWHWQKPVGSTSFKQWFVKNYESVGGEASVNSRTWNRAFELSVEQRTKAGGIESGLTLLQSEDTPDKVPRMYATGIGSDGKFKIVSFTAKDVNADWMAHKSKPLVNTAPLKQGRETVNPAEIWRPK